MKKIVLITGGSKGVGKAICRSFAEMDYKVIINCKNSLDEAKIIKDELTTINNEPDIAQCDVSDFAQVKQMVDNITSKYGRIDVLINNAGIIRDCYLMLMSDKDWKDVIDVNLTGVFNCSKVVVEHMISQKSGTIINISSLSGITGLPGQTNYSASKGGVIAFTKSLSKELARFNIRVNAIAPGAIEGEIVDSLSEKVKKNFLENIPMGRFCAPEEVASVVKFLASKDASYITGETICVTGGLF